MGTIKLLQSSDENNVKYDNVSASCADITLLFAAPARYYNENLFPNTPRRKIHQTIPTQRNVTFVRSNIMNEIVSENDS